MNESADVSVYAKASRFALKANYYYFFTPDNSAKAAMIDSALALYKLPSYSNNIHALM
jgi:hypothetical protein